MYKLYIIYNIKSNRKRMIKYEKKQEKIQQNNRRKMP